jgi:hypothetical protein
VPIGSRADPQHLSEEGEHFDRRGEDSVSHELLYTSAPRGLKPGSRGFCTVVSSQGIPAPLASALESLSSYRHVYRPGDSQAGDNPVVWSHVRLSVAGRQYSVLSRISDYNLDYSDRSNKLAHHVALESRECTDGGPAWILERPGFMETSWDGTPRVIPSGRPIVQGSRDVAVCTAWQTLTGDAGWAGVLAESLLANPERHVYIVFSPGMDLLPLIVEAIGLLPPERRWEATFSTYYTSLPPGVVCNWRCVLADSPEAIQSRRSGQALRINLCEPLPSAIGGALVDAARTGRVASALALAKQVPPNGAHRHSSVDNGSDELDLTSTEEAPSTDSADARLEEFDESAPMPPVVTYAVEERIAIPPGMPPPPPPSVRKWHRLEALRAEDARRRRQWLTGVAVALTLMMTGVGMGLWMRSRGATPDPKVVAAVHGTHREMSDGNAGESDSDAEAERPDERSDGGEQTGAVDKTRPATAREKADETGSAQEKRERAGDSPSVDSSSEKKPSEPTTQVSPSERVGEATELPRPVDDRAPKLDGQVLLPDRSSHGKEKLYYLDAAPGSTLEIPVSGGDVLWDLHIPIGLSGFDVDRTDAAKKVLLRKESAGSDRERPLLVSGELQADRLMLRFEGGNVEDAIKWCVLSISEGRAAPLLFALQSGHLDWQEARFTNRNCKKPLPRPADGVKFPLLQIDSILIRLEEVDRTFGFELPPAAQKPQTSTSLRSPPMENFTHEVLHVPSVVSLDVKHEPGSLTLAVKGLEKLEKTFRDLVESQVKELNRQSGADLQKIKPMKIETEWKERSTAYLKEIENAVAKRIADREAAGQSSENTLLPVATLKTTLATIVSLRNAVEQYLKFKDSWESAEVIDARLYYEVKVPASKQPTKIYLRFSKGSD